MFNAGEIAVRHGYDFLVVTDHLRNLKLFSHKTLEQYVEACDEATARLGIPVIPGGEMEVHWNDPITTDFSEAHTLTFSIRPLVAAGEFDWTTPDTDPFAHWRDSQGKSETILAVQEMLLRHNLPPVAAHQFAHSVVGKDPYRQSPTFGTIWPSSRLPGTLISSTQAPLTSSTKWRISFSFLAMLRRLRAASRVSTRVATSMWGRRLDGLRLLV